jgi:hypothetical protein
MENTTSWLRERLPHSDVLAKHLKFRGLLKWLATRKGYTFYPTSYPLASTAKWIGWSVGSARNLENDGPLAPGWLNKPLRPKLQRKPRSNSRPFRPLFSLAEGHRVTQMLVTFHPPKWPHFSPPSTCK